MAFSRKLLTKGKVTSGPSWSNRCPLGITSVWRRKWQPTPVLLPGKSHGLRSLVGYSPWGCKESDTTERLHFTFCLNHKWFCRSLSHPCWAGHLIEPGQSAHTTHDTGIGTEMGTWPRIANQNLPWDTQLHGHIASKMWAQSRIKSRKEKAERQS